MDPIDFQTAPESYVHWRVEYEGPIARIYMQVERERPLRAGYDLKLNSYDLGVDIELADIVRRLRFEHPEVNTAIVTSGNHQVFCSGANGRSGSGTQSNSGNARARFPWLGHRLAAAYPCCSTDSRLCQSSTRCDLYLCPFLR